MISLQCLVSNNADISVIPYDRDSIIHSACAKGHLYTIKSYLKNNPSIDFKDKFGNTPLMIAYIYNSTKVVKFLNEYLEVINCNLPLHVAFKKGYLGIIKFFLEIRFNINERNANNESILHLAVKKGCLEVVHSLIKAKANLYIKNCFGFTPLELACRDGSLDIVRRIFLNYYCIGDLLMISRPLQLAYQNKHEMIIKFLNKQWKKKYGEYAIHNACRKGYYEIAKIIVESVLWMVHVKVSGYNPLHIACSHGHLDIVKLLIDNNANINEFSYKSYTPLHFAAECGYLDIARLLINRGAIIDIKNRIGYIPLDLAVTNGYLDIVKLLIVHHDNIRIISLCKDILDLASKISA